jgi:hypothetical protein
VRGRGPRAPCVRICERPDPEPWWSRLWRVKNPRRAPTGRLSLAKARSSSERTPGGSKASKWACRPFTGEPDVRGSGRIRAAHLCVEAAGLATAGNLRPGSCVPGPSQDGRARQTSWLDRGKQPRNTRGPHAGGSRKRTHKEATARESGCGSPGRESSGGALQGRERDETSPRGVGEHAAQAVC